MNFKYAPDASLGRLVELYNAIYEAGIVRSGFSFSLIVPLYKKGDFNVELMPGLMESRLRGFVERDGIMEECQAGFRKGYGTANCIFSMTMESAINSFVCLVL